MQNKIAQILEFMKILDKVCLVKRATLLSDGSSETDSSHSFKLAWLLMMVYPYLKHKYNYTRLLELALIHDIAEAETGDCPKAVQRANPEAKKLKDAQELAAMAKYKICCRLSLVGESMICGANMKIKKRRNRDW